MPRLSFARSFALFVGLRAQRIEVNKSRQQLAGFSRAEQNSLLMVRKGLDWLAMWWRRGQGESSHARLAAALHSDRVLNGHYRAFFEKWTKEPAAALEEIEHCLERRPDLATLFHLKGRLLGFLGAGDEAIAAYTKCLEIEPKHEVAAGFLALLLVKDRKFQAARSLALATLAYDPHTVLAAVALLSCITLAKPEELLIFCKDWLWPDGSPRYDGPRRRRRRFHESTPLLRIYRGTLLILTPQWKSAQLDLEYASQFEQPQVRGGSLQLLQSLALGQNDYNTAEKWLNRLSSLPDEQHSAALSSGILNQCQGRIQQAKEAFENSLRLARTDAERAASRGVLGWLALEDNDLDGAEAIVGPSVDSDQPSLCITLAHLRILQKDYGAAEVALQLARSDPWQSIHVHYLQGLLKSAVGDEAEARAAYRIVVEREENGYLLLPKDREIVQRCRSLVTGTL